MTPAEAVALTLEHHQSVRRPSRFHPFNKHFSLLHGHQFVLITMKCQNRRVVFADVGERAGGLESFTRFNVALLGAGSQPANCRFGIVDQFDW